MILPEFKTQVARLDKQFGPFGSERAMILWRMVNQFSGKWFENIIDEKLSVCRQIPVPADFNDDVINERERMQKEEKEKNRKEAEAIFENSWDDRRDEKLKTIIARATGRLSDEDWAVFNNNLMNGGC